MAKRKTKAKELAAEVLVVRESVFRLKRVLHDNIVPPDGSTSDHYKTQAQNLLTTADHALEEAATYIEGIE